MTSSYSLRTNNNRLTITQEETKQEVVCLDAEGLVTPAIITGDERYFFPCTFGNFYNFDFALDATSAITGHLYGSAHMMEVGEQKYVTLTFFEASSTPAANNATIKTVDHALPEAWRPTIAHVYGPCFVQDVGGEILPGVCKITTSGKIEFFNSFNDGSVLAAGTFSTGAGKCGLYQSTINYQIVYIPLQN
jgi:hypothetical protein